MKKRLIVCMLVIAMIILGMAFSVKAATPSVTLKTDKTEVKPGDTFTVTVSASCEEGINGLEAVLNYDETKLELVSKTPNGNYQDLGKAVDSGIGFILMCNSYDTIKNADLYTLTLKVKENATTGTRAKITATEIKIYSDTQNEYNEAAKEATVSIIAAQTDPEPTPTPTTYIATFNTNGGSTVSSQTINEGAKIARPTDPTKAGYTFAGWYQDSELTTAYDFNKSITSNTTIYAKWTKVESGEDGKTDPQEKTYTVTFNPNGGSTIANQTVKEGAKIVRPADPTKEGYTFAGWYKDSNLTTTFDFNTEITSNTTVYAKWTKVDSTTGDKPLPKTGENDYIIIAIAGVLVIGVASFIGYRKYRGI